MLCDDMVISASEHYPRMLYEGLTLQPHVVQDAAGERAYRALGYVGSPADIGIETCPAQPDSLNTLVDYWRAHRPLRRGLTLPAPVALAMQRAVALNQLCNLDATIRGGYELAGLVPGAKAPLPASTIRQRKLPMLDDLKASDLLKAPLDELLALSLFAKSLCREYTMRELDPPAWLHKRQREIDAGVQRCLQAEIYATEAELKSLEEKETKRQAAQARLARLQARLKS